MPYKNKPRKGRKKPRTKVAFKKDGTPNQAVRQAFYNHSPESHKLYDRKVWQTLRLQTFQKYPSCVCCKQQGKIVKATDIDHVIPHRGDYELFTDLDNLWALCQDCHHIKTGFEKNPDHPTTKEDWLRLLVGHIRR